jgi:DnaK suppressor protein
MKRIETLKPAEMVRRKAALERKFRELTVMSVTPEELRVESMADPMDLVQTKTDRDIAVAELDYRAAMMRDVRTALAKMTDSEYGKCEECGEAISAKRLDAVPWARLCIHCQEEAERHLGHEPGHEEAASFDRAA